MPIDEPDIAHTASLIAEPARSRMMLALMGGKALTATELAFEADITPQTASTHIGKLEKGGLIRIHKQGRYKYCQIAGPHVAELIESLLNLSACRISQHVHGPKDPALRKARICYDHLAGKLGVELMLGLYKANLLIETPVGIDLTPAGDAFFESRNIDPASLRSLRRPLCRACLDWSERRMHLAGALGARVLQDVLDQGWARRDLQTRALHFSERGLRCFRKTYALAESESPTVS